MHFIYFAFIVFDITRDMHKSISEAHPLNVFRYFTLGGLKFEYSSFHRTIGKTPIKASKTKNENFVLQRLLNGPLTSRPKFKTNDIVRVSRYRGTFDKGYLPNWSEEYFRITNIENTSPPVYVIYDLQDEPLLGTFYGHELQKILIDINATYRIQKVLQKSVGSIFVKFCWLVE